MSENSIYLIVNGGPADGSIYGLPNLADIGNADLGMTQTYGLALRWVAAVAMMPFFARKVAFERSGINADDGEAEAIKGDAYSAPIRRLYRR